MVCLHEPARHRRVLLDLCEQIVRMYQTIKRNKCSFRFCFLNKLSEILGIVTSMVKPMKGCLLVFADG